MQIPWRKILKRVLIGLGVLAIAVGYFILVSFLSIGKMQQDVRVPLENAGNQNTTEYCIRL